MQVDVNSPQPVGAGDGHAFLATCCGAAHPFHHIQEMFPWLKGGFGPARYRDGAARGGTSREEDRGIGQVGFHTQIEWHDWAGVDSPREGIRFIFIDEHTAAAQHRQGHLYVGSGRYGFSDVA